MYVASSNSSTASSDSSTTSDLRVVTGHRNGDRHNVGGSILPPSNTVTGSRGQRSHKSTRGLSTTSQQKSYQAPPTLQSLVKTKCWSIAPLWKFVTYELETQPDQVRLDAFFFQSTFGSRLIFLSIPSEWIKFLHPTGIRNIIQGEKIDK